MITSFEVYGDPAPQGSLRSFLSRAGKVVTKNSSDRLGLWRIDIRAAAEFAFGLGRGQHPAFEGPIEGPVRVEMAFRVRRPLGHFDKKGLRRSAPDHPHGRVGDIDKFARAVLDAITGIAYNDDAQVIELYASKRYAEDWERPGATIVVLTVE